MLTNLHLRGLYLGIGLLLGLLLGGQIFAQSSSKLKKTAFLLSPYDAVYTHYHNLQPSNYNPYKAARALFPYQYTLEEREELAVKLIQIFDGRGLYPDFKSIPKQNDYFDSTRMEAVYRPFDKFPDIYLQKVGNQWVYSQQTLEAIPRLHQETFPFEAEEMFSFLPKFFTQKKFWGLSILNYMGLFIIISLPFLLHRILVFLVSWLLNLLVRHIKQGDLIKRNIRALSRPLSFVLVFQFVIYLMPIFHIPAFFSQYVLKGINLILPVFVIYIVVKITDLISIYILRYAQNKENIWLEQLVPFIKTVLRIATVAIGLVYMLRTLEFDITALLAGLSIGGLALALAAQETIKNLFGSITIFVDRPFVVGDFIEVSGIQGEVEAIGFRSTRIRTFYNSLVSIPNGRMADLTIDNYGLRVYRRYRSILQVTYDTPPVLLAAFVKGLREIIREHPQTRKDFLGIHFYEFGSSSLNILFNVFVQVPSIESEWIVREEINFRILELAEHLGVRFAFPTQTLHMESFPEKMPNTPNYENLSEEEIKQKMETFHKNK